MKHLYKGIELISKPTILHAYVDSPTRNECMNKTFNVPDARNIGMILYNLIKSVK